MACTVGIGIVIIFATAFIKFLTAHFIFLRERFLMIARHISYHVVKHKACGKDCHLHLLAQTLIIGYSELSLNIGIETAHEIMYLVHFVHHQ